VRRWEIERGLPVHRVPGSARGVVFAFTDELEEWLRRPQPQGTEAAKSDPGPSAPSLVVVPDLGADKSVRGGDGGSREGVQTPAGMPIGEVSRSHTHLLPWLAAAALAIAVFVGVYSYRQTARFGARAAGGRELDTASRPLQTPEVTDRLGSDSVAVLPFANGRGDANTDYLSDGITESLIGSLARIPRLKVRSRDSVFRYKGRNVGVRTAGSELGVPVVVSGRVMLQGSTLEISAELTNVREDTEIWGQHYTGKRADLISLQQQMAGDIAEELRSTLTSAEKMRVARLGTQDAEAYSLYLKGRYAWNNRTLANLQSAISYFNQAIARDPQYALAYSGIADAYSVLPFFGGNPSEDSPKSNAAARKALELDPTLAHPHAVLGSNEMQFDWDFAGGEAEFKKAIELDPYDATAHQWYAENLGMLGGREKEALAEINRAHELDPQSLIIRRVIGSVLVAARRYDEAISVCQQLANENPTFYLAHDCLGYAYWGKGMYAQVIGEWKIYGEHSGNPDEAEFYAAMERGFRSGGWKGALTQGIEAKLAQRKTSYASPYMIARLYADLGEKEKAFEWLDIGYREHDWLVKELNTGFELDSLRSDPRFAELVNKVGLPKAR